MERELSAKLTEGLPYRSVDIRTNSTKISVDLAVGNTPDRAGMQEIIPRVPFFPGHFFSQLFCQREPTADCALAAGQSLRHGWRRATSLSTREACRKRADRAVHKKVYRSAPFRSERILQRRTIGSCCDQPLDSGFCFPYFSFISAVCA